METPTVLDHSDQVRKHLQKGYADLGKNDIEGALRSSVAATELDPNCAEAHNLRGLALEKAGQKAEALAAYRQAYAVDRLFTDAHNNLLSLEKELGETHTMEGIPRPAVEGKKFGVRAGAYIIDSIVYSVSSFIMAFVGGIFLAVALAIVERPFEFNETDLNCLSLLGGLVSMTFYFGVFEWFYGATLGKLVLGMRVVKANGEPCGFKEALVRGLLRYIDGFFFAIPAYTSMKPPAYQRIGDKAAKTIVVSSTSPIVRNARPWWWFLLAAAVYIPLDLLLQTMLLVFSLK